MKTTLFALVLVLLNLAAVPADKREPLATELKYLRESVPEISYVRVVDEVVIGFDDTTVEDLETITRGATVRATRFLKGAAVDVFAVDAKKYPNWKRGDPHIHWFVGTGEGVKTRVNDGK